jgi:SAM-dependent methyltransferase
MDGPSDTGRARDRIAGGRMLRGRGTRRSLENMDSKQRFSDRVENYIRFRPRYPEGIIAALSAEAGLSARSIVADIGSGTGISSDPFLQLGCAVYGVEPNAAMRNAAEVLFAAEPRFCSVAGTAEGTTLEAKSIDYVVAGQAFHWFDGVRARREFERILRPRGWVVLLWNTRLVDESPFLRAYETLLHEFGTDYSSIDHRQVDARRLRAFYGAEPTSRSFPNIQRFDLAGLRGRLLSSSYAPNESHPRHAGMLAALERIFDAHERDGVVEIVYTTELYFGRLAGGEGHTPAGE